MKPKSHTSSVAGPQWHLIHASSHGKPLCGAASPDALIGSYVEHVDTSHGEARWVREVFGHGGKAVRGCDHCLFLYPSELKQIMPFSVTVTVQFEPDKAFTGYKVSASAIAEIGDRREVAKAYPQLAFTTAKWFYGLRFGMEVIADSIVPWVNKANKG